MRHVLRVLSACLLLWGVSACSNTFHESEVSGLPINVSRGDSEEVDIDLILHSVVDEVDRVLPGAFFQGMVFSGKCRNLTALRGHVVLVFGKVSRGLLAERVYRASATIDTERGTVDIRYEDVSAQYPSTKPLPLVDDSSVKRVASIASRHIVAQGLDDCEVTLTQRGEAWDVRCGPLSTFEGRCRFEIVNGKVIDDAR